MIKLRVATFAMVLATVGSQASEPQSLPEGFSLSDPKWFEGHIDSSLCRVLHFRGQRLGYVAHEMPAGDGIVFEKCVVREDGVGNTQGWFVATPRNTVFHRLELERLGPFSSPATCGSRIAYWGLEDLATSATHSKISAIVADVRSETVLCRQVAGEAWLATDNRGHLPYPRWSRDCSQLLMVDDRYVSPTRFTLKPARVEANGPAAMNAANASEQDVPACTQDAFKVIYVDDDARRGGDGSFQAPLRTLGQALRQRKLGDTVRLRPGRYDQPLELVDNVTILGSGSDWTVVTGAAYWGLAVAPFGEVGGVPAHVSMGDFALEGTVPAVATDFAIDDPLTYPNYDAATLSVLLRIVGAIDRTHYRETGSLLRDYPGLASMRYFGSRSDPESGDTLLHRGAYGPYDNWRKPSQELEHPHRRPMYLHVMQALIDAGADVDADGGSARYAGHTPLATYGRFADFRAVKLLLAKGADPNRVTSFQLDGIGTASFDAPYLPEDKQLDMRSIVRAMIDAGADHTLVHLVRVSDTERIAAALDEDPTRVDEWADLGRWPDSAFGTPLHAAVMGDRLAVAELLLERGAEVGALDSAGYTPLARAFGNKGMAELLLSHGAGPDLSTAVALGDVVLAKRLVAQDPGQVHRRTVGGWTVLDRAVESGNADIEALIREAGGLLSQNEEAILAELRVGHLARTLRRSLPGRPETTWTGPGYLHVPHSGVLNSTDELTISAWLYRLHNGAGVVAAKWQQLPGTQSFLLGMGGHDGFRLQFEDGSQRILRHYAVPLFEWVHYAATYDGRWMRVYLNGDVVAQRQTEWDRSAKKLETTINPVWIGTSPFEQPMPGLIADVQIWREARTQRQIRSSMHGPPNGNEPGLVGWWPLAMDGRDRTPHGNHGRLVNAVVLVDGIPSTDRYRSEGALWLQGPGDLP